MWVISARQRVALFAVWASVLLSPGDVVAWSPNRPARIPKTVVPKESHLMKWASAGFLAASLAFAPLTAYAEEATVNEPPPTSVKVNVETNSLIRSIEDNGGQLNKAISNLVKNIPSSSIKLDPPKEKAEAIRAAIKEESTVVEQEVTPSDAAEEVIVDQMEETTAEQVEQKVIEEPKAQVVEQVDETPTEAATATTSAEEKKTTEEAQVVENAAETPEEDPIVKVDESEKEKVMVQMTKEVPEDVVGEEESEPVPVTTESPAKQIVDDRSENVMDRMVMYKELIKAVSAEIARFWNSPSGYSVTLPSPGGQEGRTYELSKLNVVGGSLLGLGASYYLSYEYYEYEIRQEEIEAKKKKEAAKAKAAAAKKKGEKAAKPKTETLTAKAPAVSPNGETAPAVSPSGATGSSVAASGSSYLDAVSSRCGSTSSELLETVTAKAPAAKPKEETVTTKAPAVSSNVATAPAVSPSGDSTMDAFSRALAAMSNPARQNGQSNPAASSHGAKTTEEDRRPVAKSGSTYLDSLSKR